MDIVEFLRARLVERSMVALPHHEQCGGGLPDWPKIDGCDCGARAEEVLVLQEVEAKRRILDRAVSVRHAFEDRSAGLWPDVSRREKHHAYQTLLDLALPYADHPDYRQEWKP